MLHSLAAKLNSFGDVAQIGREITAELRTIIDYHNCRVYVIQPDGVTLYPVAFRGELFSEYERETIEELITVVGEGITGHVAQAGESLLTPDARTVPFGVTIPGTDADLLESMLAVPMKIGHRVIGVIVLSSLGYGRFDEEDRRLLEVLASHAAVAIENAGLLQAEREAATTSTTLLNLSKRLSTRRTVGQIFDEVLETIPDIVPCGAIAAYVQDEVAGGFRLARLLEVQEGHTKPRAEIADVPAEIAVAFLRGNEIPFVVPVEVAREVPDELHFSREIREVLVAPIRWEPDGAGALVLTAPAVETHFSERDLRLVGGVGDIAALGLGTARRMSELERFHELVEGLDAVFWEADAVSLAFTFLDGRLEGILGPDAQDWVASNRSWGEHVDPADRDLSLERLRRIGEDGLDDVLEYRVCTPDGAVVWIRDMVHLVRGAQGPRQLRGLMIDITERKRAEQALRESERKYSEAFLREREAAQRLRALDEMKTTFLEAVSHDMRTPLTSILGSALTLEQSELRIPHDEALDLLHRIAGGARKLERLLSDLLDLDRLQRGIVTPQLREVELVELIERAVAGTENPGGREIQTEIDPATVQVDPAKVERIIENLISNAIRHSPKESMIWVRARVHDGGLHLAVEDEGPGVPSELHEAVFEPFRQVPGTSTGHAPGVGIGLSLVRRFAELHGGRAWIQDREEGGASLRVFLPTGQS
jgi:PAS domain S-box-containing protein